MANVLYVEDEENDALFMRRAFSQAGMEQALNIVKDGPTAIDYLAGNGPYADRLKHPFPKVVLLDLNLPTISGFDVLEWIRSQPQLAQLPVVIFSSSVRPEDKTRAIRLGATDYLEKPDSGLKFEDILEELRKYLGEPSAVLPMLNEQRRVRGHLRTD